MNTIKILGIVACIVFLAAYIADRTLLWFVKPGSKAEKIDELLEYISTGAFALAGALGIINLFL
jgi:hypothetical protein